MRKFLKSLTRITLLSVLGTLIALEFFIFCQKKAIEDTDIYKMYDQIMAQTGQIQDKLPFMIVESKEINAYNDGTKVVLFRGLINYVQNKDELALIIGHEISHGMLRHVYFDEFDKSVAEISVAEGNADKMGAFYMMKAGYNICTAREIWKRMYLEHGNYQNADHPNYSYRYDELDVNCK